MKVIVLVSGGMDSVTALHEAVVAHRVVAGLSFDYGAKHHPRELPPAAHHCRQLAYRTR
jgi:7-cyano-7-deazaguanine synthase